MSILTSIQNTFYRQALKRKKKTATGNISTMNFSNAQSIAILFCAGKEMDDSSKGVLNYAETLRRKGKNITVLAYVDEPKLPEGLGFDAFSKKELNWAQVPKGIVVEQFLNKEYDILLSLYEDCPQGLEFLSEATAAVLKAGIYKGENAFQADLMVHNKKNDFSKALSQLDEALNKINK